MDDWATHITLAHLRVPRVEAEWSDMSPPEFIAFYCQLVIDKGLTALTRTTLPGHEDHQ